ALPPSSSDTFFSVSAEARARCLPTGVEPVNVILRTRKSSSHASTTDGAWPRDAGTMLTQPGGIPASSASFATANADSGVSSAGFATTVQPAASAGAIFRVSIVIGKFHGVIAATTPTGSFSAISLRPLTFSGITVPYARLASSPNHSTYDAP